MELIQHHDLSLSGVAPTSMPPEIGEPERPDNRLRLRPTDWTYLQNTELAQSQPIPDPATEHEANPDPTGLHGTERRQT